MFTKSNFQFWCLVILMLMFSVACCQDQNKKKDVVYPYTISEKISKPVVFFDGIITTRNGISFSPDGKTLYTCNTLEKIFENGRTYAGVFQSRYEAGKWSTPHIMDFHKDMDAYHPVVSMDGKTLSFNSRSHPDSGNKSIPHNIWFSKKIPSGWSPPVMVEGVNSPFYDSSPSVSKNGNLYFNSDRPGGLGGMDIYQSRFVGSHYQPPINLTKLNSAEVENDLVIDQEERFIIFNRYINSSKEIDLYISFMDNDEWTAPRKLDEINLPDAWELTPTLSPDGKYFFYELANKIMQVELTSLLRPEELKLLEGD